jgi:hypothetical protein
MACEYISPFYIPKLVKGIKTVGPLGDGYTMLIDYNRAFAKPQTYSIAYNIYYSSIQGNTITDGIKYVTTNNDNLSIKITDFNPGDTYFFDVRATQYDPQWYNVNDLIRDTYQEDLSLFVYPETLLSNDLLLYSDVIEIEDEPSFPDRGVIQIGYELIRYDYKGDGYLHAIERGFLSTDQRYHTVDGYDGYETLDPVIRFWKGFEEDNLNIIQVQNKFFDGFNVFTERDGYRFRDNIGVLATNLGNHDEVRPDFPAYDMSGWHRTDPSVFFKGECMDTYMGGEMFCADGYMGVNRQVRNMPFYQQADRLQEFLLEKLGTASECVLLRKRWQGITCSCYELNRESPDKRCTKCFGTGYMGGYDQYFNSRRSDGRILVRFSSYTEDNKLEEPGMENYAIIDCWTLSYPILRDGDFIIKYNVDQTEEYRYEVLDVTRNKLLFNQEGNQKFKVQRVRKTDPIYQWRAIRSTAYLPTQLTTTVGILRGSNGTVIPHTHTVTIPADSIIDVSQINQTTNYVHGHNHMIINGVIQDYETTGHTHIITL